MAGINLENSGQKPGCFKEDGNGHCREAKGCKHAERCLASPYRSGELTQGEAGGPLDNRMDGGKPR